MAKQKRAKETRPRKKPHAVSVDAPSGEGKQMQIRTVIQQRTLLTALRDNRGHIGRACEIAGVTRQAYYHYLKTDPDFAQAVENIRQGIVDDYVEALHDIAIGDKFFPAVKYFLNNHAKDRGFGPDEAPQSAPVNTQVNVLSALSPEQLKQLKEAIVNSKKV